MTATKTTGAPDPTEALHPGPADGSEFATNRVEDPRLRLLATRAVGMTGADIERVVREARQKARRQQRPMTFEDVEAGIRGGRPQRPYNQRWRFAIHEAGHAVVHHSLELGDIVSLTIDHKDGGFNSLVLKTGPDDTEDWYGNVIAMLLAGRAAEDHVFRNVTAGSGGMPESDLARATALALSMETTLGFSAKMPLLYRDHKDATAAFAGNRALAAQVNARLEAGLALASQTIEDHKPAFTRLVRALFDHQVLDGPTVMDLLAAGE